MEEVTVLGAGVAGLTCAVTLAERGCRVAVIERSEALGGQAASWLAGGMLAPWCERESAEPPVVALGREALDWWPKHYPPTKRAGSLILAPGRDLPELERFARRTEGFERVDADGIAAMEPDLAGRFRAGLLFRKEAHLDPRAALSALAERLQVLGGTIRFGRDAAEHRASGRVIDCRGMAARDRLHDLRGVRGEMLLLRSGEVSLSRPVRLLHPRFPLYIVPRGEGLFLVGATMIESDRRGRVTARSLVELLNAAYALHPAFAEAEVVETGCEVRPAFPDNLPRIRWRDGRLCVNGCYRHGFLLAPALARMAADALLNGAHYPEVMDEDHGERRSA
ncbi:glycine oxidase ThiO [Aquibaculum sediminis]|uniref:glycine oxidase ThiO n=1 Tax=Aquibaculum sediminis TaxID=3231907 RepID=UPI003F646169